MNPNKSVKGSNSVFIYFGAYDLKFKYDFFLLLASSVAVKILPKGCDTY